MEDQAEKVEALKKAYAEIILNTAKEAAARTMVSESKALRFHHDLRNTKDEALQMLLRFKHMMDSKTTEAEITSLTQQKRIQELDSQLNETEEVIVDLRAQLRKAHERLEEAKNSHMLHSNEPSENQQLDNSKTTPREKMLDPSSTITGSKEPELYRNGYTHRIRAIERNLVDEKSISDDHEICTKKKELLTENSEQSACRLRRSIRKRKVRCWDEISSLFKSRPTISHCKKYSDKNGGHKSKSLPEISPSTSASEETKKLEVSVKDSMLSAYGNDKNTLLKYTFSRKRKKDLLSKSDNCPSFLTNKMADKQIFSPKNEMDSDSQKMVEVACQLISLSGKHSL